ETDLPDRAGKTRACLTAGPNQPEHKKTDTPWHHAEGTFFGGLPCIGIIEIPMHQADQQHIDHCQAALKSFAHSPS
ncbi:hypothetical protein, partial [Pseudomonas syringae]|uniref:hypothetical protein n=1 Tax=Pseudomonas syringae TaxID=317 RepID=UPI001FFB7AC5